MALDKTLRKDFHRFVIAGCLKTEEARTAVDFIRTRNGADSTHPNM
jgi:hypothetical protein